MSRVPAVALGRMAICPVCRAEFVITGGEPDRDSIPTVFPVQQRGEPAPGLLYGLAISAFLMPLTWLLLNALQFHSPVFTLALPFSIAVAACGLGVGVARVRDWSFAFRIKAILMLLGLCWGIGVLFYFLKPEWVEEIRRDLGIPAGPWQEFKPPAGPYRVKMPGPPRKDDIVIVQGWALEVFRFADRNDGSYAFAVGHARPKEAAVGADDDKFFAAARDGATAAARGTLVAEKPVMQQGQPGREYVFKLGDQATNRTVRVFRVGTRAVVAMAEGAFLPPDARDVRKFFDSLYLLTGR